jgi:hypothetical protein
MRHRIRIPPASELRKQLVYKDDCLYWIVDRHGNPMVRAGYLAKGTGYRGITFNGVSYAEHRIIWRLHHPRGAMPFVLDHIDGNRANNKITNLRKATESENQNNRHPDKVIKVTGSGILKTLLQTKE